MSAAPELPADGLPAPDVLAELRANRHDDADWRNGRIFGLIFHPDDDELEELLATIRAQGQCSTNTTVVLSTPWEGRAALLPEDMLVPDVE